MIKTPDSKAIVAYSEIEAGIALMLKKHGHVLTNPPVVVNNSKALAIARADRMELVRFRTTLEKTRVAEKASALAYGRLVDSEAARIQAIATPIERAYDTAIKAEDDRLDAIEQKKLEAERQRIARHRARIQEMKDKREEANMAGTSAEIKALMDSMAKFTDDEFEEFQESANAVFTEVSTVLQRLFDSKSQAEQQAAELKLQRAKLAESQAWAERRAAQIKKEREDFEARVAKMNQPEAASPLAKSILLAAQEKPATPKAPDPLIQTRVLPPRPTDDELINCLAQEYEVSAAKVVGWLRAMDFNAALQRANQGVST